MPLLGVTVRADGNAKCAVSKFTCSLQHGTKRKPTDRVIQEDLEPNKKSLLTRCAAQQTRVSFIVDTLGGATKERLKIAHFLKQKVFQTCLCSLLRTVAICNPLTFSNHSQSFCEAKAVPPSSATLLDDRSTFSEVWSGRRMCVCLCWMGAGMLDGFLYVWHMPMRLSRCQCSKWAKAQAHQRAQRLEAIQGCQDKGLWRERYDFHMWHVLCVQLNPTLLWDGMKWKTRGWVRKGRCLTFTSAHVLV